ncbi:hypothetical protein Q7P35_000554 [Cladosporium inversicolor]
MPRLRTSPNIDRIWYGALSAAAMPMPCPSGPPARSKRVPGNLLVGSLSGKSFQSGDATFARKRITTKGILIEDCNYATRPRGPTRHTQGAQTDLTDLIVDPGGDRLLALLAADDTTVPPHMSSTRSARARLPDILTGGPSLLDAKRILPTCAISSMSIMHLGILPLWQRLGRACRSVCPIMYTNHSFPVKELPHPSKDQDHQELLGSGSCARLMQNQHMHRRMTTGGQ